MKYLRRFNESMVDYEDFLFSFFDKDADFIDQGDDWIYLRYDEFVNSSEEIQYNIVYEKLKRYLNGPRFLDMIIKSQMDYGDFYILITKKEFFNKNIKVEDLNWQKNTFLLRNLNIDAEFVGGLPNNCKISSGFNSSGGTEFRPNNMGAINVNNNIELQYLLYKYAI